MSQKYKSFSRGNGRTSDCGLGLPPGVKRIGYLRKLKKMKRRFFVLHMESNYGIARLEYYSSEKKWKLGSTPRRCIELKLCLNISRKLHSKHKNVIALYTQDDCFSLVTETAEELELWLNDLLEVQRTFMEVDENARGFPIYEHLWQVMIDRHDLEYDRLLVGPYRVALSSKSLFLIKMNPLHENDYFEFPLMSIRRCGHSKDHFFIELGRSAVIGAGEIYMATEGTIVAQNMHETVLSAMKSSKIREDGNPFPRPRSASTSENSNPVTTRRPIGIVAPQTVSSSISSCGLSNSRERCDSLPARPKTISGNSHNCVLSALSSPYASSGATFRRLSSRPHSMYEWPSCNSPSSRSTTSFSPSSLSNTTACSNSIEDMDKLRHSLSYYPYSLSTDSSFSSDRPITEVPDEYLRMSVREEKKFENSNCLNKKKSVETAPATVDYIDMKSSSVPKPESVKKLSSFFPPTNAATSADESTAIKEGYLDMSCLSSVSKDASIVNPCQKETNSQKAVNTKPYELEKVLSLLKIEERAQSVPDTSLTNQLTVIMNDKDHFTPSSCTSELKSDQVNRHNSKKDKMNPTTNTKIMGSKPPIPERTYRNGDHKTNVCPPLPLRKPGLITQAIQQSNKDSESSKVIRNTSPELLNKQDLSQEIQIENSELDEQDVFYNTSYHIKSKSVTSPNQNTNFSCLNSAERNASQTFPCAPICSGTKISCDATKQAIVFSKSDRRDNNNSNHICRNNTNTFCNPKEFCDNSELKFLGEPRLAPPCKSSPSSASNYFPDSIDQNSVSCRTNLAENTEGDYVNIEFSKTSNSATSNQIPTGHCAPKGNPISMPKCPNSTDPTYCNILFGKPFCPTPKPIPASCETVIPAFNSAARTDRTSSRGLKSPTATLNSTNSSLSAILAPKFRNIPNTLPTFRKQMSAPAAPLSLRPELPSPGRKSSCPVTASASMLRPSVPGTSVSSMHPVHLQSHGVVPSPHLRVSTSRSPDHSSVSSISSASDEISSTHSSPKTQAASQNFSVTNRQSASDSQYENVVIPQRSSTSSRPPSTSSEEKELNYALLDLTPSAADEPPRSPTVQKPPGHPNEEGALTYAEIDFTKSEGLKNISGSVREGRL